MPEHARALNMLVAKILRSLVEVYFRLVNLRIYFVKFPYKQLFISIRCMSFFLFVPFHACSLTAPATILDSGDKAGRAESARACEDFQFVTLDKVIEGGLPRWHGSNVLRRRFKYLVISRQIVVYGENQCEVATPITVVGCTPHGHQTQVKHFPVTLHNQLMCPRYQ